MAKKNVREMAKEDENWKAYIRSEDDSTKIWKNNWGCMLKKKLDKKTEQSVFLSGVKEIEKEDNRKLSRVPESVNHVYGWVAGEEDFRLQKYGPDNFKPLPLPKLYRLSKR
ncbi:hypothetical protein NQ314_001095 [Rhamnusium bicolor]|uniref:Uncharacterized protein n=1 Tax=Rhamnusium bicolor TaxID=1586634 RepID=A0AAV8ZTP2_9CUCU|nr:hypothetical protein NQ314_001095 [Rhamnusium bicolor]